jgi:Cu2+-containing amine oxidase
LINGGFAQYEKIREYVIDQLEDDFDEISDELIKTMLIQLKELMMVHGSIEIGGHNIYFFNPLQLSEEEKAFIEFAIDKKPMTKKGVIKKMNWEEEKILTVMKALQEKKILRIEKNKIKIPGIIQEKQ